MSDKHTPTAEQLQEAYEYWASGCGGSDGHEVERLLAAHDKALREQIARDIEAEPPEYFSASMISKGLAARIARGEGDAHRPERCPTCGCELAYPTAVHVVDCGEGSE